MACRHKKNTNGSYMRNLAWCVTALWTFVFQLVLRTKLVYGEQFLELRSIQTPGCKVYLAESMPEFLTFPTGSPKHISSYDAWRMILNDATYGLNIASVYWTLLSNQTFTATNEGRGYYRVLKRRCSEIRVTIAQNGSKHANEELDGLADAGAKIYWIDVTKLAGRGILHTKLHTSDGRNAYIGSANMDWRSLTEIRELGALMWGCYELVTDVDKIHATYVLVADGIPKRWPRELETEYNQNNPMRLEINGIPSRAFFSSSPPHLNPPGRANDLNVILSIINKAQKFIHIEVMDYLTEIFPTANLPAMFWPDIDDALRRAAIDRKVEVCLLVGNWPHTANEQYAYVKSLQALNGVRGAKLSVRWFTVPVYNAEQGSIPYARVNHAKFMVTETTAYIGTSNWSGNYFLYTGGIGFVVEQDEDGSKQRNTSIREQLEATFQRDWNSKYSSGYASGARLFREISWISKLILLTLAIRVYL
ncbi:unnamed protein product [Calicophoron daubneyi]|uniref:PLD phosphodiesterase domain-containing protein n=1 Tax=Calicophoron daubneyi TaxID=300641 RepID=A0AAV2TTF8_CALDB